MHLSRGNLDEVSEQVDRCYRRSIFLHFYFYPNSWVCYRLCGHGWLCVLWVIQMAANKHSDERLRLIKLIHVGRRELNMDEESYRLMLANIPELEGATSSANLSVPKLKVVLELLKQKGFKVVPKAGKSAVLTRKTNIKQANDPQSKLIRHLWLELHNKGAVRDPSEAALNRFVLKRVQVEALQWLSTAQASQVIEHLKQWLKRADK